MVNHQLVYLAKEGSNIKNNTSLGTINLKAESRIGILADEKDASGNVGYDTKGSNVRGGVGLRVIFQF